MDSDIHLEKNPIQKVDKTAQTEVKLPHVNKKTASEKAKFCSNTVFSLYFKITAKKFPAAKLLAFSVSAWPKSLLQKLMKMCEQIWKKVLIYVV